MSTDPWPAGVGRLVFDRLDSTNAEAARRAPELALPTWIHALRQTAGRGRRGQGWRDPPGNLAATLVLRAGEPPARAALRSFVAALALFDAFVAVTGRAEPFALKWPNDVLVNGGKAAGILLETLAAGGDRAAVAIGFGVNLASAPVGEPRADGAPPTISLGEATGVHLGPEAFLEVLAPAYARREAEFAAHGFAPIRAAWLHRAARIGQPVTARTGRENWHGTFETLDGQGALVLDTASGRRAIPAAEIFF